MQLREIPLDQLVAGNAVNSRRTGRDEGIAELAASIAEHGLLQSPLARPIDDGRFEIVAGNRRFLALRMLAKNGKLAGDHPIPCIIGSRDDDDAFEASLAENVMRLPPHPIDQYEAFPTVALAAATAALGDRWHLDSPLKFRLDGYRAAAIEEIEPDDLGFVADLRGLINLGMSAEAELINEFARRIAGACDLRSHNAQAKRGEGEIELTKAVAARFEIEALKVFDRERYFGGINGDQRKAIAAELGAEGFPKKKGDQIGMLTQLAENANWLPPELRAPAGSEG